MDTVQLISSIMGILELKTQHMVPRRIIIIPPIDQHLSLIVPPPIIIKEPPTALEMIQNHKVVPRSDDYCLT